MAYIGPSIETGFRQRFVYTATAGQTSFSGNDSVGISLTYTDSEYLDVYQNGVLLVPGSDYAATTGTTVVLVTGASLNDKVEMIAYQAFGVADTVSRADGGAFGGAVSVAGDITSSGTFLVTGDTAAGDDAAMGFTSAEGLILTGQGSTNDVTIKNDADTAVIQIPTGGTAVSVAGILTAGAGSIGMGPAFAASAASGQSAPSNNTFTKVVFGTETFDTDGKFATNRFTPTVIGYYQINGGVSYANANYTAQGAIIAIYKNGSSILAQATTVGGFEARHGVHVSGLVYLDADDYVELFIYGPNQALDAGTETFFNGAMVRKA